MNKHFGKSAMRRILTSIGAAPLLVSCGTSYLVEHSPKISGFNGAPGVYFALPRTNVSTEFVATETRVIFGDFYEGPEFMAADPKDSNHKPFAVATKERIAACGKRPRPKVPRLLDELREPKPTYKISDMSMATRSVTDFRRLYRLNVSTEMFASYTHTVELTEDGRLKASKTDIEDGFSPVALKVFGSLIDVAVGAVGGAAQVDPNFDYCAELAKVEPDYRKYQAALKKLTDQRLALLTDQAKPKAKPKAKKPAAAIDATPDGAADNDDEIAALTKKIAALKEATKDIRAPFEKQEKTKDYVVLAVIDPPDFAASEHTPQWNIYEPKYEEKDDATAKAKRIALAQGVAVPTLQPVVGPKELREELDKLVFQVSPWLVADGPLAGEKLDKDGKVEASIETVGGYRYRVPVAGDLRIFRKGKDDKGGETKTVVASATASIAQFGPVVSLPSRFKGASGSVDLTYNNDTGGLSKAVIGAKPVAPESVSGYIDGVNKYLEAERKADKAKEDAAKTAADEAATAETKALQAEREYLQTLKEVRALRAELGVEN
jgi:hypothetical protein